MCNLVTLAQKSKRVVNPYTRTLRLTEGELPQAAPHPAWGIDPGVNFGLTIVAGTDINVFHGTLEKTDVPGRYGLIAYQFLRSIISGADHTDARIVIEGAAYGAPFRQVELSEIRTGFFIAAALSNAVFDDVIIKPPATIRKGVFNNGKVQAMDEFPTLNHNAADSLAMALYAADMEC